MIEGGHQPGAVPGPALPVWPPPTALSPAGAGGGGFQARANAAVLPASAPPPPPPPPSPAPPPPPIPQQPRAPIPQQPRAPAPQPDNEPVWPAGETSAQYGDWARRQRPQGTVYGGAPPAYDAAQRPEGRPGFETSGSLTGHILAQGRPDRPAESSNSSKIVMIILIAMSILVVGGLGLGIAYLAGVFH